MHKPWHTLLFVTVFFILLAGLAYLFPENGIVISNGIELKFPSFSDIFSEPKSKKDISRILDLAEHADKGELNGEHAELSDAANARDTSFIIQGAPETTERIKQRDTSTVLITSLQFRNISALSGFFNALTDLKSDAAAKVRVLHYGDSQIEGDRISDLLRMKLQARFGGSGPGLVSLMPISSSVINKITVSGSWDRYNCATIKDKRVQHRNFGPLAGFTRFSNYKKLSDTSVVITASVNIATTHSGGKDVMQYKKLKLFYGGAARRTWCEFYDGPALMAADSLQRGGYFNVKEYKVGQGSFTHSFKFRSKDSPDFYGVSLESDAGLMIDNIALRGSSGTFFHLINPDQLREFYQYLNVKLIILQFGGNALPAMTSDTTVRNYASWIRGQITIIRRIYPGVNILFIGPADMNVKEGTDYVTHPYLEAMRDELKKVVLESGCAFFDMYDCMGGRNSMSAWVDAGLAASDYIHFSPQGARKVAALLHAAIIEEYERFLKL